MCIGDGCYDGKMDPAVVLAGILTIADVGYDKHLRKVLREKWERIRTLAHAIHEEETSPEAAIRRAAQALGSDPGNISSFMTCVAAAGLEIRRKD